MQQHEIEMSKPVSRIPFRECVTASIQDTIDYTSIGKTKLFELIKNGEIETVKIGDRRLVKVKSVLKRLGEEA